MAKVKDAVRRFGEAFVVLDSGEVYSIHGLEGNAEFDTPEDGMIRVEGLDEDSGEYVIAEFSVDAVEHIRTHKEL